MPALSNLTPYITPVELIDAETGIDWGSFPTRNASGPAQLAAQMRICWAVTEQMDMLVEQTIRSTVVTETKRGPDWDLTVDQWTSEGRFRASRFPILSVLSGQWSDASTYPPQWISIPQNQFLVDDASGYLAGVFSGATGVSSNYINIAPGNVDWTRGRNGYRCQVQYVAGFPNCGVLTTSTTGVTAWHVDDIAGWGNVPGGVAGRVYDGSLSEGVFVNSVTPDTVGATSGPGTLTLANATSFGHVAGTRITAMPAIFQQAALYLATRLARLRGATAYAVQGRSSSQPASKSLEELLIDAEELLAKFLPVIR
jgi:hypothetical protein